MKPLKGSRWVGEREGFALRTTIACRVLGGEVKKMTCNRDKNSMKGKDLH